MRPNFHTAAAAPQVSRKIPTIDVAEDSEIEPGNEIEELSLEMERPDQNLEQFDRSR